MAQDIPPIPNQAPISDESRIATPVWSDWFEKVFRRVGGHLGTSDGWETSKTPSGYQKLPSGLIIQWGVTGSLSSGSISTIPFPIVFESACFQVIIGLRDMSSALPSDTGHYGTGAYTKIDFELYNRTASTYVFNWIAVGA